MRKVISPQSSDISTAQTKSKERLIQHNSKLYSEILSLQSKISALTLKSPSYEFQSKTQAESFQKQHEQITRNQFFQIKKLKKKILLIKNADKPQQKEHIRQAEDELIFLKKQRQKYEQQRGALFIKRKLKQQGLDLNKPMEEQQKKLRMFLKSAQRQNLELKTKGMKIQKQINSLHKRKELAKTSTSKQQQTNQLQIISQLQKEIQKIRKQINNIYKEWQPRIDSLNNEYFVLKQIKQEKQKQTEQLVKVLNMITNRVLVMKQETKIIQNKNRLAQVVVSPQKRNEIIQIYRLEKEKRQQLKLNSHDRNLQAAKASSIKVEIKQKTQSPIKQTIKQIFKTEPIQLLERRVILANQKEVFEIEEEKKIQDLNEFQAQKLNQQSRLKVTQKQSVSVAVGTTFYLDNQKQD